MATSISFTTLTPLFTAPAHADSESKSTDIMISPGTDETQLNLSWRTKSLAIKDQFVQLAPSSDVKDGEFPESAVQSQAERTLGSRGDYHNKATITGLTENTEYSYRVGSDATGWSEVQTFDTESFGDDWNFLYMGDPQIGASGDVKKDTENWLKATDAATQTHPDSSILMGSGDQVNIPMAYSEFDGFLSNPTVRSTPTSVIRGNHELGSTLYNKLFNMPGESNDNYYYEHNNALVVGLDSNESVDKMKSYLKETINAHRGDNDWVIVTFHHAPYSQATHRNDPKVRAIREQLSSTLSELNVDLVLSGHDHVYTRTHLMDGTTPVIPNADGAEDKTGTDKDAPVAGKPGDVLHPKDNETLYVNTSSSTGSKFYSFMDRDGNKPDVTPEESFEKGLAAQSTAMWNQDRTPDYTNVEVSGDKLTVHTYNVADGSQVDSVTLSKN